MFRTKTSQPAKDDIKEAARFYNSQKKGLGKSFVNFVRKKVRTISQNPYAYSIKYGDVRTVALDVFPYTLHFTIESNLVVISAVFHTCRKPIGD